MNNQSLVLAESHFGFDRYIWYYQDEIKAVQVSVDGKEECTGQIHWARITKIHQGLKGAFVELTGKKSAFLPLHLAKGFMPLTEGQYLIVQVTRDAIEDKELRVSTNITLRGLYWVAYPNRPGQLKLSKKIHAKEDAERIVDLAEPWAEYFGLTARTAARSTENDGLIAEYQWISSLWEHINIQVKSLKKPTMLVNFAHPLIRLLLEDVEVTPEVIIFNSAKVLNVVADELEKNFHFPTINLAVSEDEEQFEDFGVEDEFWQTLLKKVPLKGGGSIIIEETAAATLIDVNAGNQKNLNPKQAQEVNFLACHEIAKQVRLRNLSGQILIDFISVKDKGHNQQILGRLRQIMAHDLQKMDILGFSRLGILEMTRQKIGHSISQKLLINNDDPQFCYPLQRSLILKQIEAELKHNPKAAFKLYGSSQQMEKIKFYIQEISPPQIDYVESEGEIILEIH